MRPTRSLRHALGIAACVALVATGCLTAQGRRPGLRLSGELAPVPADWSFTDAHREIAIQVRTPYLLPHSVTIWCGSVDGRLYVGARAPDTKRWPGWADRRPDVRLGIAGRIYEVTLERLEDPEQLARVRGAYAAKYDLPYPPPEDSPPIRYWRVRERG